MKVTVELHRVAKVSADVLELLLPQKDRKPTHEEVWRHIHERYKPHSDLRLFWASPPKGEDQPGKDAVADGKPMAMFGMRAMAFEVEIDGSGLPQGGLIVADPLEAEEVARLDGALNAEVQRVTEYQADVYPEQFEWRVFVPPEGRG